MMSFISSSATPNAKPVSLSFPGSSTQVVIGCGTSAELPGAAFFQGKRIFFVADQAVTRLGLHAKTIAALEQLGHIVAVYDEIAAEPTTDAIDGAIRQARDAGADAVVGMGGGSAMDTAKLTALALTNPGDVLTLMRQITDAAPAAPLALLPTTSGTGSEVSPYAVATAPSGKVFATSGKLYPLLAVVDPLLTVSAPPRVTAATGIDALTHAIEGALGAPSPYSAALAAQCFAMTMAYLPRAVENGHDLEARTHLSWVSVLGMLSYLQGGGLYAHSASYVLSGCMPVAHGVGCGVALPYCIRYCREEIAPLADALGRAVGLPRPRPEAIAEVLMDLLNKVGLPSALKAMDIRPDQLPQLANRLITGYPRA